MARITDVNHLLFPVEEHPVFAHIKTPQGERRVHVPERKAIVNGTNSHVIGVVSQDYQLVTNQEALDLGKRCCAELFEEVKEKEWTVFKVDAPSTASFCHIDLIHKTFVMNFLDAPQRQEVYVPYVRVTNSYNAMRALRFDVGFCRRLCSNGVVFESETISFRYSHTRNSFPATINFDIQKGKLKKMQSAFANYIATLQHLSLPAPDALALLTAVIGIPQAADLSLEANSKEEAEYRRLQDHIATLVNSYRADLGENAFSLFNAMTDLASNPPKNRFLRKDVNAMQRAAGAWLRDFSGRCTAPDFAVPQYLTNFKQKKADEARTAAQQAHAE